MDQLNIRKYGLLDHVLVVRADAQPHIERTLQRNAQPSTRRLDLAIAAERHVHVVSPLGNAQPLGSGNIRLNFTRECAFLVAKLQRSKPTGMQSHVCIDRVCVETLAKH